MCATMHEGGSMTHYEREREAQRLMAILAGEEPDDTVVTETGEVLHGPKNAPVSEYLSFPPALRWEAAAHHEAGHVVAAMGLGRAVIRVALLTEDAAECGGVCWVSEVRRWTPRRIREEIMIRLAGKVAEETFLARVCPNLSDVDREIYTEIGMFSDMKRAWELGEALLGTADDVAVGLYLEDVKARIHTVLDVPREWAAVGALAQALLQAKVVSGRRARSIVGKAHRGATAGGD
jgi:hypothetical protein